MPSNEKLSSSSDYERLEYLLRTIRVVVNDQFEKDYSTDIDFQLIKNNGRTVFNSRRISELQPMETKSDIASSIPTQGYKRSMLVTLIIAIHFILAMIIRRPFKLPLIPEHKVTIIKNGKQFKVKLIKSYPCTHHKDSWGVLITLKVIPLDIS